MKKIICKDLLLKVLKTKIGLTGKKQKNTTAKRQRFLMTAPLFLISLFSKKTMADIRMQRKPLKNLF